MGSLKESVMIFIATHHKHVKYIVLFLVATSILVTMRFVGHGSVSDAWGKWVSPVVGFTTMFVSMAVWLGTEARAWVDGLPKRLDVTFKAPAVDPLKTAATTGAMAEGQRDLIEIMSCTMAYLSGEGDIRAAAQQIGSQMASPKDDPRQVYLKFTANPKDFRVADRPSFRKDGNRKLCKVYSVTICLLSAPDLIRVAMLNSSTPFQSRQWDCGKMDGSSLDNQHWQDNFAKYSALVIGSQVKA